MKEELEQAVKVLKHNKVPGLDKKPSKLWRSGGADLIAVLFHLIMEAWNTEQMPREWHTSIICPIHKKGDKLVCNNYRSISLLCVPHKLFTSILQDEVK
jgi:hypothetical protein